ncbi:MAG: F0F1 ATP synthase subunit B [Phycisphaerae bacterium]
MIKRIGVTALVWLATGAWAVGPVLAAGEEHGEAGPNLFTGDLGNIFWSLLTFGLVIAVLGKFAWGPLLNALQKREQFIHDSLSQAKADREAAEARLKEYDDRLHAARGEASAIVDEGRRDAEVVKNRIQQEARKEADAMVSRAKREIELARDTAVSELYSLTAALATNVAGRIVHKELDAAAHEGLVTEAIESIGELEPGRT